MKKEDYILPEELRSILSKYYERKYLSEHDIPESMIIDQTVLSFSNHQDDNLEFLPNNELWDAIHVNESKRFRLKRTILVSLKENYTFCKFSSRFPYHSCICWFEHLFYI